MLQEHYGQIFYGQWERLQLYFRDVWNLGFVVVIIAAAVVGVATYWTIGPSFNEFRQGQVVTKSDIGPLSSELQGLGDRLKELEASHVTAGDLKAMQLQIDVLRAELAASQRK